MRHARQLLISSLFAVLAGGTAMAADLDPILNAPQEDPYVPVEIGTGWYIRADVSYDLSSSTSGSYRTYGVSNPGPPTTYAYGAASYDDFKFASGEDWQVGVGYQYNNFLRGDVTAGYWRHAVTGHDSDPTPCSTGFATAVGCRSVDTATATAWEVMANAYADLGTFVGFTPYVGAGAGVTHLTYSSLHNVAECYDAAGAGIPTCGYTADHAGLGSWRMTWALMAGTSYDLSKNLKFDLGYRYAHVAGGDMFSFDTPTQMIGATGTQGRENGFSTHQFKAGIRYSIW